MGIAFLTHTFWDLRFSLAAITYFVKLVTKVPKRSTQKVVLLQKSKRNGGTAPIDGSAPDSRPRRVDRYTSTAARVSFL
jgi:hypothetical protein